MIGTDTNRMHFEEVGLEVGLIFESLWTDLTSQWPFVLEGRISIRIVDVCISTGS